MAGLSQTSHGGSSGSRFSPGAFSTGPIGRSRPYVHAEFQPAGLDVGLADIDCPIDDRGQLDRGPVKFNLSPRDPRHVQEVVDQSGFHLDVAVDHFQRFAHRWVKVWLVLKYRHAHDDRSQPWTAASGAPVGGVASKSSGISVTTTTTSKRL